MLRFFIQNDGQPLGSASIANIYLKWLWLRYLTIRATPLWPIWKASIEVIEITVEIEKIGAVVNWM